MKLPPTDLLEFVLKEALGDPLPLVDATVSFRDFMLSHLLDVPEDGEGG